MEMKYEPRTIMIPTSVHVHVLEMSGPERVDLIRLIRSVKSNFYASALHELADKFLTTLGVTP